MIDNLHLIQACEISVLQFIDRKKIIPTGQEIQPCIAGKCPAWGNNSCSHLIYLLAEHRINRPSLDIHNAEVTD